MKKSVMFVLGRWGIGGVERVTATMANAFASNGWKVCIVVFEFVKRDLLSSIDNRIDIKELGFPVFRWSIVRRLRNIMRHEQTQYVINQWASPFHVTIIIRLAMFYGVKGAKIIAFHHTTPDHNARLQAASGLKKYAIKTVLKMSIRLVYRLSDAYVLLSQSLMPAFREFTGLNNTKKLAWLPNPLEAQLNGEVSKEDIILYVGRLSQVEKRVDRVLAVWEKLSMALPNWRLEIVGDGPDRTMLQESAKGLRRLTFCGFQNAFPYYQRSKILLLTSDFEGFPMVLIEAMSNGCVPVAYGSYATVYDIIHRDTGIVVPMPWSLKHFAEKVLQLAKDNEMWNCMSRHGRMRVMDFSVENVFKKYVELLGSL